MKNLLFLSCFAVFFACSSDDGGGTEAPIDNTDYFPATETSNWNYDYTIDNNGAASSGSTVVNINGSEVYDGGTYQILDNTTFLIGTANSMFFKKTADNEVTIRPLVTFLENSLDFGNLDFLLNSMSSNQLLDEATVEIVNQPVPISQNGITGTVIPKTYITVKVNHVGKSNSLTVNQQVYETIAQQRLEFDIRLLLDIQANANLGGQVIELNREHELVGQQQYGTLNMWMAKDIGIIKTNYDYSFENINLTTDISVGGLNFNILDLAPELANFNNLLNLSGTSDISSYSL